MMPNVHPGKVGTIGLTMTVGDKIMTNLVGIDIGCGMSTSLIKDKNIEFQKLDKIIRENIPSGFCIRKLLIADMATLSALLSSSYFLPRGSSTINVLPFPSSLSTSIIPLCIVTICFTIKSPSPNPWLSERLLSAW